MDASISRRSLSVSLVMSLRTGYGRAITFYAVPNIDTFDIIPHIHSLQGLTSKLAPSEIVMLVRRDFSHSLIDSPNSPAPYNILGKADDHGRMQSILAADMVQAPSEPRNWNQRFLQ